MLYRHVFVMIEEASGWYFVTIVKPTWLEHHWDHGNLFVTWVLRATEC